MPINQGLRHDRLLREQAAQMFERGFGYGLTARKLGVSAATVREWQKMYRQGGAQAVNIMPAPAAPANPNGDHYDPTASEQLSKYLLDKPSAPAAPEK